MLASCAGVDVGGTFTDLVVVHPDGGVATTKVPSTPADQSIGVADALTAAAVDPAVVLAHGMTVATNALLERRGARTALVTTEGFADVIEIARQNRPSLYDLAERRPSPLVPRDLRFVVRERVGPAGVITPLDEASVCRVGEQLAAADVEAVAISLLFSFVDPTHERRVAEILRERLPDVHFSISSEVLPEFREYERTATVVADAYLRPRMVHYLGNLVDRVAECGIGAPFVMRSSGGVTDVRGAMQQPAGCVLSGPAGGVVGAATVATASGFRDVLTLDMGGTSADVAAIVDGRVITTTDAVVAGVPLRLPMLDVHTVSAGGGSIASIDAGGALRVGPSSAGARPGPACYGHGGTEPTVTDANLALGLLREGATLGGAVRLDRAAAMTALAALGERIGMDAHQTAIGIRRVADNALARALRVVSVERGLDPRDFALLAFGGAGPMHACAAAHDLGVRTVLVPRVGGVLSALGLAVSDLRSDAVAACLQPLDGIDRTVLDRRFEALEGHLASDLPGASFRRQADLRYRRQSFEITVDAWPPDGLADRFGAAHEQRYGFRANDDEIEVVSLRVTATRARTKATLVEAPGAVTPPFTTRSADLGDGWASTPVYPRGSMGAESRVVGPAVVEFDESTCVVAPGWQGVVDDAGTLILEEAS